VVASGLLFARGVLLKDGGALERLAEIDGAVFDKTGTLTLGRPQLMEAGTVDRDSLAIAAGLAAASTHPLSRALVRFANGLDIRPAPVRDVSETPGSGLAGTLDGKPVRLGNRTWCGVREDAPAEGNDGVPELWLAGAEGPALRMLFSDEVRPDAAATLQALAGRGLSLEILSGDRVEPVRRLAVDLGIGAWHGGLSPKDKLHRIESLADDGRRILVAGDGLNDGPALAAGHVSIAPSSASDLGQTAADLVFLGDSLTPVAEAHDVACRARRLVRQNFAFAALYNVIAVPLAAAGLVTPLIAAVAMSSSSLIVIANALRLRIGATGGRRAAPAVPAGIRPSDQATADGQYGKRGALA
jgi:Cu2+-exporting ATPase